MDQVKIGAFLKELRKGKKLSQEQLAEKFNVTSRNISRWENGNTMPDISIIIELADYYEVDIRELLNGERKSENMDKDLKETLNMVADYTSAEKEKMTKSLIGLVTASAVFFILLGIIICFDLTRVSIFFESFFVCLTTVGFTYSIMGVIKLLQITGRMNKKSHKNTMIKLLIIGIVLLVLSILLILWSVGIV